MTTTQYQLSWDSYRNNVCDGFTNLQQNEEFVDMTLAADGYMVKVHKNIFALASPYIKSILQSSPTEHPIFFLSNISHDILNYILTYVYTGEVSVDVDKIKEFMRVAKELRLSGLFGMPIPKVDTNKHKKNNINEQSYVDNTIPEPQTPVDDMVTDNEISIDSVNATQQALTNIELLKTTVSANQFNFNLENVGIQHTSSNDNIQKESEIMLDEEMLENRDSRLYTTADGYQYKLEIQPLQKKPPDSSAIKEIQGASNSSEIITSNSDNNDNFGSFRDEYNKQIGSAPLLPDSLQPKAITPQYTMSNRDSLQLILNRYMYYCHHQSHGGRKRRWRCIEYRSRHCPAFIDTDGEVMVSRKFEHCHTNHDEKIRKKMNKNLIYTNLNLLIKMQNERNKRKKMDN